MPRIRSTAMANPLVHVGIATVALSVPSVLVAQGGPPGQGQSLRARVELLEAAVQDLQMEMAGLQSLASALEANLDAERIVREEEDTSLQNQIDLLQSDIEAILDAISPAPIVPLARGHASHQGGNSSGNFSTRGPRRNDWINTETLDVGDNFDVTGGPRFTAPVTGVYLVSYRQVFRNPTNEGVDIPAHWQYGIWLRLNGRDDFTYYTIISDLGQTSDYITAEMTDVIPLSANDTLEAMEALDPLGGTTVQQSSASFSVVLLHR